MSRRPTQRRAPARRSPKSSGGFPPEVADFLKRRWWVLAAGLVAFMVAATLALFLGRVPLPEDTPAPESSKLLAADGQLIATLHGEQNRTLVELGAISQNLRKAVVATEDRNFYRHSGVSMRGIVRALFTNVRGGEVRQGGSTITQQYVRNAFIQVGKERTIVRKLKEAALAIKVERKFSKDKILGFYLNTVYFGRGAYGAEAAARAWFGKPSSELSISEAAMLAGVIRSPQRFTSQEARISIRNEVLGDMVRAGAISTEQAAAARGEELKVAAGGIDAPASSRAAYFVEYVRRLLKDEFNLSDERILSGGLEVHTTLDLRIQAAAEAAITSTLDRDDDPEAALVAMDPRGNVKAMVGGRRTGDTARARGFNFAWQKGAEGAGRQGGSAFKPFTLAAFVEEGYSVESRFSAPGELEIDSRECRDADGKNWVVGNFENASYGNLAVREATTRSVNTVYAQMIDEIGPKAVQDLTERAGGWGSGEIPRICSLALGTPGVTPLEMARAFSTFAARGRRPEVVAVSKIVGPGGKLIAERGEEPVKVMDENVADTVNDLLQDVIRSGTARGKGIGRPAAGKTGTTQNHVDAWFVGYTPQLVAAVWMGYPPDESGKIREMTDVRGRSVTGGSFPASIWQDFMKDALDGVKGTPFARPEISGEVIGPPEVSSGCPSPSGDESPSPCPSPSPAGTESPGPSPAASPSPGAGGTGASPPSAPSPAPTSTTPSPPGVSPLPLVTPFPQDKPKGPRGGAPPAQD